jgi:hypothetical protein
MVAQAFAVGDAGVDDYCFVGNCGLLDRKEKGLDTDPHTGLDMLGKQGRWCL